ncbi:transketolase [Candidatus Woesebacteria bacterium]|nr:transketolase [Candidatus Woesebacteria bacterium]MCD8507513.1 transketolase [Candidatus Woesebacteria bacterium]MCD8527326.1 transketolase [Candidatus Woesebacteria bacterium]MCD8545744.1 transketolase [Candidatus Woesebacteria bacterium]
MSAPVSSVADAQQIRELIVRMLQRAGSGHAGGPLGMADLFAVLYRQVLQHNPHRPQWEHRDRVVLSNGHTCPVLYATLALHDYFPEEELWQLRRLHAELQGHPHQKEAWGIETSSGPLGQGVSQAVGMAVAAKFLHRKHHIYCFSSDGEHQEGQVWEAYLAGAKYAVDNMTILIDRNYTQISGVTEQVMPLDPLKDKISAFGWRVYEINGHDHEAIFHALQEAKADGEPSVIIAYTEPGHGVSFMEGKFSWHDYHASPAEARRALNEVQSLDNTLENLHHD